MKKKTLCIIAVVLLLAAAYFIGTGFIKNASAYVEDFSVSEDGTAITLRMGIGSSMGFIRDLSIHQQHGGKLYLDPLSAFGGLNGSIGAKDTFTIPLETETSSIAIYRNVNCYEVILEKGDDGIWRRTA